MTSLGMGGSRKPRTKPGDFGRLWEMLGPLHLDKTTKAYLSELVAAEAALVKTREEAEVATAEAKRQGATAREAEDRARSQREAFATETAETESRLTAERNKLATWKMELERWAELLRSTEDELHPRELALRRAFDAYEEG